MSDSFGEEYFKGRMKVEPKHEIEVRCWINSFGLTKEDTVLDFGCGAGARIHCFRKEGINAEGVETSEYARTHEIGMAKDHILEKPSLKKYELICCVDVLEHVDDKEAEEILKKISLIGNKAVIGITFVDNQNFEKDETHINGKKKEEWKNMLLKYYKRVYNVPAWFYEADMYFICVRK